jgi:DNA-3-methyladenine glycosylase
MLEETRAHVPSKRVKGSTSSSLPWLPTTGLYAAAGKPSASLRGRHSSETKLLPAHVREFFLIPDRNKPTALSRSFYDRDPRDVGPDLLGKILLRKQGGERLAARIVEVEAYLGAGDPAAHAATGKTSRNAVLFGPPGYAYVYFIYGNHYCLNVSCLPDGIAGGILFRALQPLEGIREMLKLRGMERGTDPRRLTSGPGRLAAAFGITRERDNGKDLTNAHSDLYIADDGMPPSPVLITKRIGITKAADMPLRYVVPGNRFVSGKLAGGG